MKKKNKKKGWRFLGLSNTRKTVHHLVAKSRSGNSKPNNLQTLSEKQHTCFHILFGVKTPIEQMLMLLDINRKCLNPHFVLDFLLLVKKYNGNFIKKECYEQRRQGLLENVSISDIDVNTETLGEK